MCYRVRNGHTCTYHIFLENYRAIENPENLARYHPSGKAQKLHFRVIAAATPPV